MSRNALNWRTAVTTALTDRENFHSLVGLDVLSWEDGLARVALDIRPEHGNGGGSVHGGVLMSLLDTASGLSGIYATDDAEPRGCVTVTLSVKFMKPAIRGRLIAEGRRQGGGKSIYFTYGELRDEAGDLIATADGTFRYRQPAGDFIPAATLAGEIHPLAGAGER